MNRRKGGILVLSTFISGCAVIAPIAGGDAVGVPISSKSAVAKREPHVLVADDASICLVSAARFEKVEIGDSVLGGWHDGHSAGSVGLSALAPADRGN